MNFDQEKFNKLSTEEQKVVLQILKEYTETQYANWWPLWYHIGTAESALGHAQEAIDAYKKALSLSPSNTSLMSELAAVYDAVGDETNAEKYRKKIAIVMQNIEDERGETWQ